MNFRQCVRLALALGAGCALLWTAGCQGRKIVARVHNEPVYEDEFFERAIQVPLTTQKSLDTDAGGLALVSLMREKLTDQAVAEKKYSIDKSDVARGIEFLVSSNLDLAVSIAAGKISRETLLHDYEQNLKQVALGSDGARVEEKALQESYNKYKDRLVVEEQWAVRLLRTIDEQTAKQALERLKATQGNFQAAARIPGVMLMSQTDPARPVIIFATGPRAAQIQQLPALRDALAKLKPNEFTTRPVKVDDPQATSRGMPSTTYLVGQMAQKISKRTPTLDEVRPIVRQYSIQDTHPDWQRRFDEQTREFTRRHQAEIVIYLERYKPLLSAYILPKDEPAVMPSGSAAPPPGAPPAGAPGSKPGPGGASSPKPAPQSSSDKTSAPGGGANGNEKSKATDAPTPKGGSGATATPEPDRPTPGGSPAAPQQGGSGGTR